MAVGQHGGELVCDWRVGVSHLLFGVCGYDLDDSVLQLVGDHARLLLFDVWAEVWVEADGAVEVLLWMVWGQDQ